MNKIYFDHYLETESEETHHLYPKDLVFQPPIIIQKTKIENFITQPFHEVLNYDEVKLILNKNLYFK